MTARPGALPDRAAGASLRLLVADHEPVVAMIRMGGTVTRFSGLRFAFTKPEELLF